MLHCLLILHLALLKSVSACNTELQANCRNISNDRSETFKTKLCWERNKTMCVKSTERFVSNSLRSILSFFILYIVNDTILKTKSRRRNENSFRQLRTLIFVLQVRNFVTKFRFDSSPCEISGTLELLMHRNLAGFSSERKVRNLFAEIRKFWKISSSFVLHSIVK